MAIAQLVLDYLRALVWPTLLLFALIFLRRHIGDVLSRVSQESEQISASAFGVEFTASFKEAREEIQNLARGADSADADQLRRSVKEAARKLSQDEFRILTANFYGTSLRVRRQAAKELTAVATSLSLEAILDFARSVTPGERVGAAIALRAHLQASPEVSGDPQVRAALHSLLRDRRERVRYRAVEALKDFPDLVSVFDQDLRSMASTESNLDLQRMVRQVIGDVI